MFELTKVKTKLANYNPRKERCGDELEDAGDIKFELHANSGILDSIDPELRAALFRKPRLGDQQDLLDPEQLTAVRFPRLEPLRLQDEWPGYRLEIHTGLDLSDVLTFEAATLKRFVIEPLEGGSVAITFSAAVHPDVHEQGVLCSLQQRDIELSVLPPVAELQQAA